MKNSVCRNHSLQLRKGIKEFSIKDIKENSFKINWMSRNTKYKTKIWEEVKFRFRKKEFLNSIQKRILIFFLMTRKTYIWALTKNDRNTVYNRISRPHGIQKNQFQ